VPLFPIKIRCPGFSPLQLRISPVVLVKACGELKYETDEYFHTSKLSIILYKSKVNFIEE